MMTAICNSNSNSNENGGPSKNNYTTITANDYNDDWENNDGTEYDNNAKKIIKKHDIKNYNNTKYIKRNIYTTDNDTDDRSVSFAIDRNVLK